MFSWWSAAWSLPSSWCARRRTLWPWWRRCWLGSLRKMWRRLDSFSSERIWRVVRSFFLLIKDTKTFLKSWTTLQALNPLVFWPPAASHSPLEPWSPLGRRKLQRWLGLIYWHQLNVLLHFCRSLPTLQHQHCQMWWSRWTWRQKKPLPWLRTNMLIATIATTIFDEGLWTKWHWNLCANALRFKIQCWNNEHDLILQYYGDITVQCITN